MLTSSDVEFAEEDGRKITSAWNTEVLTLMACSGIASIKYEYAFYSWLGEDDSQFISAP